MQVTVAIPTYNRCGYLRQTLEGIARQDFPRGDFEVIVVDNNSTDGTREMVGAWGAVVPGLRLVVETKQGLDHARNRAVAEAAGDIVLFADDDILVEPDWVRQMAAPFAADGRGTIGAVGGEVIPVFPDGLPSWVSEWHSPLGFRPDAGPLAPDQSPMGANLAFRRSVFAGLGLFHTELDRAAGSFFSGGDAEMVRRVRAAGLQVWFAPAAAVRHQLPAGRTTFRYACRHAFDSARSRVIDRACRPGAAGYLLTRLGANAAKAAGFGLAAALGFLICPAADFPKKSLVRAWRSCGYLYQIPRSLCRKT